MKNVSVTGQARMHQQAYAPLCVFVGALLALLAPARGAAQITWTNDNNPVLSQGAGWESRWVHFVSVIDQDSQYVMWYSGGDNTSGVNASVGRATSTDGKLWTKDTLNPVMGHDSSAWDGKAAWVPKVLKIGDAYTMWFTGANSSDVWQIGRATSSDGRVWVQDTTNPVIRVGAPGQWDAGLVHTSSVLFDGTTYRMWYTGMSQGYGMGSAGIGLATSGDGIHWVKDTLDNPVLAAGPPGAWDQRGVGECSVVYNSAIQQYLMFYVGNELDYLLDHTTGIGYAWSADGIHWTKSSGNPVLGNNLPGSWTTRATSPFVFLRGSTFHMWYSGAGNGVEGVGYATSPSVSTAVAEYGNATAARDFRLQQNYPNPFNPTTTIRYNVGVVAPSRAEGPASSNVRLVVYDLLGREVKVLVDQREEAGTHEVTWDARGYASGVYLCRMNAGAYSASQKMILAK